MPNMSRTKIVISPDILRISSELLKFLKSKLMSQTQLAKESGVKQYQLNRILKGRTKSITKDVQKLCIYAKIPLNYAENTEVDRDNLYRTIDKVWDGEESSAKVLGILVEAIGPIVRQIQAVNLANTQGDQKHTYD